MAESGSRADVPPVALFVFNRPDLTALAVKRLAAVRPATLLVVADGPRDEAESHVVAQTLAAVGEGIDWDADVRWCVSATNLGCSQRLNSGLDWVFSQVGAAVVVEDDIELDERFFPFAAEGLRAWRDDPAVAGVCARNELVRFSPDGGPFLTRRGGIWGWATWADRWQDYRARFDSELDSLTDRLPRQEAPLLSRLHAHFLSRREWETSGVWDIAWSMWSLAEGRRFLVPAVNMSINHGFRPDGTHTAVDSDLRGDLPLGSDLYPRGSSDPAASRTPAGASAGGAGSVAGAGDGGLAAYLAAAGQDPARGYDELATLLDIAMLCAEPRRWRMMARHSAAMPGQPAEAVQIMLQPWLREDDMRAVLEHLAGFMTSPHLDELRAVFA